MPQQTVSFDDLTEADLIVDAVYKGGTRGNVTDDPLARLVPCGNQGGFRVNRGLAGGRPSLAVLYTSLGHQDWPDSLDIDTGRFTYFGDNRTPGRELHDTPRRGNQLLREVFEAIHSTPARRTGVPPFLVFTKGAVGRDVIFRGLAVPGATGVTARDDLIAVWRDSAGQRFQNYRATFTVLDIPVVPRPWISRQARLEVAEADQPPALAAWRQRGLYQALRAPRVVQFRSRHEQLPGDQDSIEQLRALRTYFQGDETAFEPCAALIFQMAERNVVDYEVTRAVRDGGRDAIGRYRIGSGADPIYLDFALEAKCYTATNSVGVREMSRLISRLRHRQFGVLVTTSYVDGQAYSEIRADGHPVVILSGRDIVDILRGHAIVGAEQTEEWLRREFPR